MMKVLFTSVFAFFVSVTAHSIAPQPCNDSELPILSTISHVNEDIPICDTNIVVDLGEDQRCLDSVSPNVNLGLKPGDNMKAWICYKDLEEVGDMTRIKVTKVQEYTTLRRVPVTN